MAFSKETKIHLHAIMNILFECPLKISNGYKQGNIRYVPPERIVKEKVNITSKRKQAA